MIDTGFSVSNRRKTIKHTLLCSYKYAIETVTTKFQTQKPLVDKEADDTVNYKRNRYLHIFHGGMRREMVQCPSRYYGNHNHIFPQFPLGLASLNKVIALIYDSSFHMDLSSGLLKAARFSLPISSPCSS